MMLKLSDPFSQRDSAGDAADSFKKEIPSQCVCAD